LNISSLTGKTTECGAQTRVNPKLVLTSMESLRNSKIISAERNKLCSIKAGKRTPGLSSMKNSRYDAHIGVNHLQSLPSTRKYFTIL
jgi:hypothetical protein